MRKSHLTAVVAIPPENVWEPIQKIRRAHDRHVNEWMPHVTLLYPFRPREESDAPALEAACTGFSPFEVTLATFRFFRRSATVWLEPEPSAAFVRLQASLQRAFPDCDDVARHENGFTPHLSVGQTTNPENPLPGLQAAWRPLRFHLDRIALIRRPSGDAFAVDRYFRLSGR